MMVKLCTRNYRRKDVTMSALLRAPAVVPLAPPSPSRAHVANVKRRTPDEIETFQSVDPQKDELQGCMSGATVIQPRSLQAPSGVSYNFRQTFVVVSVLAPTRNCRSRKLSCNLPRKLDGRLTDGICFDRLGKEMGVDGQ